MQTTQAKSHSPNAATTKTAETPQKVAVSAASASRAPAWTSAMNDQIPPGLVLQDASAIPGIQAKLAISQPNDPYEQEADRVAEQVMRMPATPAPIQVQRKCACGGIAGPTGECEACAAKRKALQRKATSQQASENTAPSIVNQVLRSGNSQPLDAATRAFMEPRFGTDFSQVRVHADGQAAESAQSVSALAYTVGSDVVFGSGQYRPETSEGQRLLAHELTHVVQQNGSGRSLQRQVYGPPAATGAGSDFDMFMLQFTAVESAAIAEGYGLNDRISAFRKLYYDSGSTAKTYAGATVGGGVWNILIPGAAGATMPRKWSSELGGAKQYLQDHQILNIGGVSVDIGHLLAGADASKHPTAISLAGGLIKLPSNQAAAIFIGDLGSVVTEYIHNSGRSMYDTARVRSSLLETYYDKFVSIPDMAGNADAYALTIDSSKTLAQNLQDYYAASTRGAKKRYTTFAAAIGLGTFIGGKFSGDTPTLRTSLQEQAFNSAQAYAAGKGWKGDVINVQKDPGPGIIAPTFWEMYWNVSEWVVDIFIARMMREVARE